MDGVGQTRYSEVRLCSSEQELIDLGHSLAQTLKGGEIICLYGDLGAGKTTCVKGIAQGLQACSPNALQSPTFTYLHVYAGRLPLYHFDLYRLYNADEFIAMGFDDYLFDTGVACIEWPERIESLLKDKQRIELKISTPQRAARLVEISYITPT